MKTETFTINNFTMETSVTENEFEERKHGIYENQFVNWFTDIADDIDLFVDVGAFTGYYSLHMLENDVKTIAYEPSKEAYEVLRNNLKHNFDDEKFSVCQILISNNTGYKDVGIGGCGFAEHKSDIDKNGSEKAMMSDLEGEFIFITSNPDIDWNINSDDNIGLKIDTEGMELEVLEGIRQYWDNIKYLCVEFHPSYVDEKEIDKTLQLIEDKGFTQLDADVDPFNSNDNIRFVRR